MTPIRAAAHLRPIPPASRPGRPARWVGDTDEPPARPAVPTVRPSGGRAGGRHGFRNGNDPGADGLRPGVRR
ncbi:hypothetical protein GCM10027160_08290 [Streptomyces calidiresistens]